MCTVTWLHTPRGYQLLCNRDERHMRKPAIEPMIRYPSGVRVIAPIDGGLGGARIRRRSSPLFQVELEGGKRRRIRI